MKKTILILCAFMCLVYAITSCRNADNGRGGAIEQQDTNKQVKKMKSDTVGFVVMFYNVENLFDIYNDPQTDDDEFLPSSAKKWNKTRYQEKLNKLAKVIRAVGGYSPPAIVGLAEVENKTVLLDLAARHAIAQAKYDILHYHSTDPRGIDVAMLYNSDLFKVIQSKSFHVEFPFDDKTKTRDILYAKGIALGSDTIHVFVNHWKSRYGGRVETERYRVYQAKVLRRRVDSIFLEHPTAKILIMGDMNDEPQDKSLSEILRASNKKHPADSTELYNLMYDKDLKNLGSYRYKQNWNMLDNIIVSQAFLHDSTKLTTSYTGGEIFKKEWITYRDKSGNYSAPNRTYGGKNYYGGYSDHFPVSVTLYKIRK